jgi:hypothetical protein
MRRALILMLAVGCTPAAGPDANMDVAALADTPSLTQQQQAAVDAMVAELRPRVRSLSGEVDVYHYASREALKVPLVGALDLTAPVIAGHPAARSHAFFESAPANGGDSPGLYVAIDPISSVIFGGDHPLLYRIRLPKGYRYVDLIPDVGADARAAAAAAGCQGDDYRYMVVGVDPSCRPLAYAVIAKLGVQALLYDYLVAGDFKGCKAKARRASAFVLLDVANVVPNAMQVFAAEVPTPDPVHDERVAINGMFLNIADDSILGSARGFRLWPQLDSEGGRAIDWMNQHLLYCNGVNE